MLGRALKILAFALLIHATVSAVQHRQYLKLQGKLDDESSGSMPVDIVAEIAAGVVCGFLGLYVSVGPFNPIDVATNYNKRPYTEFHSQTNFMIFNHRRRID